MLDYKMFRRLYIGDPVAFYIAVELLLQNGRVFVLETPKEILANNLARDLKNLFAKEKQCEVAGIAKGLAKLETVVLLDYMKRAVLDLSETLKEDQEPKDAILSPEDADGRIFGIDIGYAVLEISAMLPAPDKPVEVSAELVFADGERQDIAMIRPTEPRPGCEVLAWTDPEDECYTEKFQVTAREEDVVS